MRRIDPSNFQRATRATPREINHQIVLNLVREYQPISRADLARRMEVAPGIMSPWVNQLIKHGLLYEEGTGAALRGRKPTLLRVRTGDRLAVAIDVRASETQLMLCDFGGRVLGREALSTPPAPDALLAELAARVRMLLRGAGQGEVEGIGLAVPGMVERGTGRLVNAPTLGWCDVDLRGALERMAGIPVHIERDAVACAHAQMWLAPRAGEGHDNFAYVTVSDGVGAGLVVDGRVLRGARDTAGEFGHIPLSLSGPACRCGSFGCWEAYTSNAATVARYLGIELCSAERYAAVRAAGLGVPEVIARARAGDEAAAAALQAGGRFLGVGLAAVVGSVNPARIIVGGEIAAAWDLIGDTLLGEMARRTRAFGSPATTVVPEPFDHQVRLRGAAALVVAPTFAAPSFA